jgi:hypothetical protein
MDEDPETNSEPVISTFPPTSRRSDKNIPVDPESTPLTTVSPPKTAFCSDDPDT